MKIVNFPHDLNIKKQSHFNVFDYKTSEECHKQMVSLHQNTFSFLLEGSKEVFSDKTSIAIENSNFLLMKKGHCLMTEKLPPNSLENYRSILFFFSNEAVLEFIKKHTTQIIEKHDQPSIYSFKYDDFIKTFVISLVEISKLHSKIQTELLALKFEELMMYLKEFKGIDFMYSLVTIIDNQLQHFNTIIETNKLNKLTIKELAFLSNMSVSTFKREFEKHYKSSPSKWFQDKRLEHAAFLLKNKLKRPTEIFEEIGYENLSSFIQAFKSKFGVTPKQFQ